MHTDRLADLEGRGAFVRVLDTDEGLAGAVGEALTNGDDEQVFVYGFADFLEAATDAIAAGGGAPDEAKTENFG
jgi:ferredoxin-NADP reductase